MRPAALRRLPPRLAPRWRRRALGPTPPWRPPPPEPAPPHRLPPPRQIVATGGALLHSPVWTQIVADALGQRVVASAEPEASSRGAALLALVALGALPDLAAAPARLGAVYYPDAVHHATYQTALARQRALYARLIAEAGPR